MFSPIPEAIKRMQAGEPVIVLDDEDRENEGDLIIPAQIATVDHVRLMINECGGLICVPLTQRQAQRLNLQHVVPPEDNTESTKLNMALPVNAIDVSTGISAHDRLKTIKRLANPTSSPLHLTKPGHVFPLIAHTDGLRGRQGHTEAAVTLAALAGYEPCGITCEIINRDGTMARLPDLMLFAKQHKLAMITIKDLIAYVNQRKNDLIETAQAKLPTAFGAFSIRSFRHITTGEEYIALTYGDIMRDEPTIVRINSQCVTGEIFSSLRCDCKDQLHTAMKTITDNGSGVIVYLFQEGRGIGLTNKIKAYELQDQGFDTVEANHMLGFADDERDYAVAAKILLALGIQHVRLLTNNPRKMQALIDAGISVHERLSCEIPPTTINQEYLKTKKEKLGHMLSQTV